jgi:2'-hydroxyisoflavone reductase
MDVLVLGGTSFVGRAVVDELLARGHAPTIFSRGVTNPGLFPDVPRRQGDRDAGDYGALAEGRWDGVVDVSAYTPRHVGQAMDAVADRVGRYLLISTVSVFDIAKAPESGLDEDAPRLADVRHTEEVTGDTYGGLKVACEDDVWSRLGDRATVVRPGIVAGPHDPTDRFTYWARRGAAGGRVAVPGRLDQPVQVVDCRDLATLCVRLLEDDRPGAFNAVGPATPVTLGEMVRACASAAGTAVELVPVAAAAREQGFPLVLDDPGADPLFRVSRTTAEAAGLGATPLETTARDTAAWDAERGAPPIPRAFTPEQEAAALEGAPA